MSKNVISYIECIMSYQTYFLYTINKSDEQRWPKGCYLVFFYHLCPEVTVHYSYCKQFGLSRRGLHLTSYLVFVVLISHRKREDCGFSIVDRVSISMDLLLIVGEG